SGTVVTFQPIAESGCGTTPQVTCTPASGSVFPPGTNTVTCVATDALRNSARCTFRVIVADTQPPVILPEPVLASCSSPTGAVVRFDVVVRDNCDAQPTAVCFPPSGSQFPIGTNTVTCVATDAAGNQSTAAFPVIVSEECAACLELTCPAGPISKVAGRDGTAVATYTVAATNVCGGPSWVRCEPPTGSSFPVGNSSVICVAGIGAQVLKRCEFQVSVRDVTPPTILARSGMTVKCQEIAGHATGGAVVNYTGVTIFDNADPSPTASFNPPSGSFLPLGTNIVECTATDTSGNHATVRFPVIVEPGPACEVDTPGTVVDNADNWDFELGLRNWTRTGTAFNNQPTVGDNVHVYRIDELREQFETELGGDYWRDLAYPIGHHSSHWIGTAENHADDATPPGAMQGERPQGTLLSKPFQLAQPFITFLIGGPYDDANLRVELLLQVEPGEADAFQIEPYWYRVVKHTTGHGLERMRREAFDASDYVGKTARLRIVDTSISGHINVDDFRFQAKHPAFTRIVVAGVEQDSVILDGGHFYDWDAPVWGLADLHTHPIAHLGLGQRVFHGKPDGMVNEALENCNCNHGGHGLDNDCGNYLRQLVVAGFDGENIADPHQLGWDSGEWTRFRKWPIFTSYSHQQMWWQWVQRAYDGGLRVMVALTVHNRLLAGATVDSVQPYDDRTVMTNQIAELKAFVDRHSDFMEIALSPQDLRRIVRDNKLAIIIGSETDNIGNFDQSPVVNEGADVVSRTVVKAELQKLYDLGLRYIFPVHLTDNKFGGTAVYNPLFTIATKHAMGVPIQVEPAGEGIVYRLPNMDMTSHLPSADKIFGALAEAVLNPFAPIKLCVETQNKIVGNDVNFSDSSLGLAGVGAVATLPLIATSPGSMAAAPALIAFFADLGKIDLPSDILPLGGNYPNYTNVIMPGIMEGHRNSKGLTSLGEFAIKEMMRLGMMVDLDHMGEKGVTNVLDMAEAVPGGYPMNSGHNSFRAQRYDASENSRTPEQLLRIRQLGGLMGLGWGNGDRKDVGSALDFPRTNSTSQVINNSPGSSKTFAHAALYALEFMQGQQLALGSDINGFVVGPGPRFGPQSAFGLYEENEDFLAGRSKMIKAQDNGVAYEPRESRPNPNGVFQGKAVDPDKDDEDARTWKGYAYNKQQRDFFLALRIFRWGWQWNQDHPDDQKFDADYIQQITDGMHDVYDRWRVKEFARGLLLGPTNGDPGSDTDPDVNVKQKLAKAVYRNRVLHEAPPSEISNDETRNRRYHHFLTVWDDYAGIYGTNAPLHRSQTQGVEWDYNWEGLAHYGLLPDFFQDLSNVGLNAQDMSPMFKSAEDFARMWTRCLWAADAINHPGLRSRYESLRLGGVLHLEWYSLDDDVLEESTDLRDPNGWHPFAGAVQTNGSLKSVNVPIDPSAPQRFYRLHRP
ncbi:MAG TPA: HYR domain-containing protein, partial [Candidatus Saccharimonadales bacterium]|nr:HYR domain-containing protein [Candidatus Saccharimonadales bacterium]